MPTLNFPFPFLFPNEQVEIHLNIIREKSIPLNFGTIFAMSAGKSFGQAISSQRAPFCIQSCSVP